MGLSHGLPRGKNALTLTTTLTFPGPALLLGLLSSTKTGVLLRSDGLLAVLPLLAIEVFPFFRAPGPKLGAMMSMGIGNSPEQYSIRVR